MKRGRTYMRLLRAMWLILVRPTKRLTVISLISNSKLPTQKAVRDYITNNLGPYINKPYSTNAVPRALVELTDSGKISVDQIPALRPFSVFTVANQAERTSLEGALAGDIAIQQDTATSFILNNDTDSLFLGFNPDTNYAFTIGDWELETGDWNWRLERKYSHTYLVL